MATSLDGRLLPERWPISDQEVLEVYDSSAARLDAGGWIVGRETMQHYVTAGEPSFGKAGGPRTDIVVQGSTCPIAVCFDRKGRLQPEAGEIDGDHLVLVVSEGVSFEHVEKLVARGVSVFFAGPNGEDIAGALDRIGSAFGADRLLLEGGGRINGAFLAAGLVDDAVPAGGRCAPVPRHDAAGARPRKPRQCRGQHARPVARRGGDAGAALDLGFPRDPLGRHQQDPAAGLRG
ncbi:MAG TPA: dihydrofolate reductase family protein, partial [Amaricoccus sp.]|nr:dihydrofolate reductase family protein [Amaricoccus sp.]